MKLGLIGFIILSSGLISNTFANTRCHEDEYYVGKDSKQSIKSFKRTAVSPNPMQVAVSTNIYDVYEFERLRSRVVPERCYPHDYQNRCNRVEYYCEIYRTYKNPEPISQQVSITFPEKFDLTGNKSETMKISYDPMYQPLIGKAGLKIVMQSWHHWYKIMSFSPQELDSNQVLEVEMKGLLGK